MTTERVVVAEALRGKATDTNAQAWGVACEALDALRAAGWTLTAPADRSEVLLCDAEEADWPDLGLPVPLAVTLDGPLLDAPRNASRWMTEFDRLVSEMTFPECDCSWRNLCEKCAPEDPS